MAHLWPAEWLLPRSICRLPAVRPEAVNALPHRAPSQGELVHTSDASAAGTSDEAPGARHGDLAADRRHRPGHRRVPHAGRPGGLADGGYRWSLPASQAASIYSGACGASGLFSPMTPSTSWARSRVGGFIGETPSGSQWAQALPYSPPTPWTSRFAPAGPSESRPSPVHGWSAPLGERSFTSTRTCSTSDSDKRASRSRRLARGGRPPGRIHPRASPP